MEAYAKQIQQQKIRELMEQLSNKALEILTTGGLKDRAWKEFKVGDLFDVVNSRPYHKSDLKTTKNGIPYITRTSQNNALEEIVENNNYELNIGNSISLGAENADFFYQENNYLTGNKMYSIRHEKMNKYVGWFLVQVFRNSIKNCGFGYGKGLTGTRFKNRNLLLPTDQNGNIDWQFMEDFMRKIEQDKINTILEYYKNMTKCQWGGVNRKVLLSDWRSFEIEDVCEILSGKDIYERERIVGEIPYITATANNNGIGYFVNNINETLEKDCISVNRNGSVGYAFYHPYKALFGNDTRKLKPKTKNKYTSLFISMCITAQREKYGYGYKMGTNRLKKQKILLPTKNNAIDWQGMEDFIKQKELKKMLKVLEYYNDFKL